jgi:hypothetical protein
MKSKLNITATGHGASRLGHIGTVADVINADLPKELLHQRFDAANYAYGFELATPKTPSSIGDSILLNNLCYTTSTDDKSTDYQQLIYGKDFISGGMLFIPHEAKPSHHFTMPADNTLDFMMIYNEIYATVNQPFVFVGLAHFITLQGTAIGKPPIDKHNIFQCKEEYYPYPNSLLTHANAFVMGGATNYGNKHFEEANKELEVVLYKNPLDVSAELTYHAHLLLLRQAIDDFSQVSPDIATKVLHLFAEGSTLSFIKGDIYTVDAVDDYTHGT